MQIKLNIIGKAMRVRYIFIVFLLVSTVGFAQNNDTTRSGFDYFKKRVYLMGGLGLNFGNVTVVNVSPVLGYRFTNKIHGGIGISYTYFNNVSMKFSTNIYGGNIFGRFFILENLFAHLEYEKLYLRWSDGYKYNLTNIYIGGGYNQRLGGNAFAGILVLYNLNQSPYSPYSNPIIRGGIGIGF